MGAKRGESRTDNRSTKPTTPRMLSKLSTDITATLKALLIPKIAQSSARRESGGTNSREGMEKREKVGHATE